MPSEDRPTFTAPRWVFFLLFTLSGFSGLIYESIWSHYLKLFLGHAAYAQSLVLIIFMGGLAGGSWLAARLGTRWRRPILAYAVVEGVIGVFALLFHDSFVAMTDYFYVSLLPGTGSAQAAAVLMWTAAAALIVPQSLLLGMTFPLLSGGLIRRHAQEPGRTLAMLYFTNSIGGALGVLASGFWLIELVGLPGTLRIAGLMNLVLAAVVATLVLAGPASPPEPAVASSRGPGRVGRMLLVAAFVTGLASFIYEVAWIRMLSLVLGSATHSFELMLSAFLAGLAFGGLWIRGRVDRLAVPLKFAASVQIVMGVLAALSVIVFSLSFNGMSILYQLAPHTDNGYRLFMLGSHGIALAVMFPTTFVAGMTLPLFTHVMMREGTGEAAIGRIYAANTVGGIAGVLFAMHAGLPLLGLKFTIGAGAVLDVALGAALLTLLPPADRRLPLLRDALPALLVVAGIMVTVDLSRGLLTSGVYRSGAIDAPAGSEVVFYQDGKTATVSVLRNAQTGSQSIATNGKTDASLQVDFKLPPTPDERTMVMLGALPVAYKPGLRSAAVIGLGSGLSTHVLLADPVVEQVDTVEIEPAMVAGARLFGDRVRRAFDDPRGQIRIEDAKAFFAQRRQQYDVVVSEPSNPWVSGVAGLFSTEFYARVRAYIADDGLLVQWIHFYEFNDDLMASVLKAMAPHFRDYAVYSLGNGDGIIVASTTAMLPEPDFERILSGALGEEVRRIGYGAPLDIALAQIGTRATLAELLDRSPAPPNSDFHPYVDLHAVRARFEGQEAASFIR
jgi:spermidine synthase